MPLVPHSISISKGVPEEKAVVVVEVKGRIIINLGSLLYLLLLLLDLIALRYTELITSQPGRAEYVNM